jgi:zinc protease
MNPDPVFSTPGAFSHTLPGEADITRVQTSGGITVLARSSFSSPAIAIQGYLPAGSLLDPPEKLGLANFTAAALMRGTASRSFQAIYEALESAGASLGFSCGILTTTFGGQALVEDLDLVLGVLCEALSQPVFPPEQVERLRAQYLTSLAIRAQDTAAMAALAFDANLYPGHPYARPEDGFTETVASISRDDLASFRTRYYGPRGMVIGVVGAVEPQAAVEAVQRAFEAWQNPAQEAQPPAPGLDSPPAAQRTHVPIPGKSQADVVLGCIGPERRSPDFMAASLGNSILGQFGMYGRIGQTVRETAGLAYYAYSSLNAGTGPGAWYASAGVDPANLEKTIHLISGEFQRMASEPVTAEELQDVKDHFIGRLPLTLESNAGVASAILYLERYELGLDYYHRLPGLVSAVTKESVLEAARNYLDFERLVIATAGSEG